MASDDTSAVNLIVAHSICWVLSFAALKIVFVFSSFILQYLGIYF